VELSKGGLRPSTGFAVPKPRRSQKSVSGGRGFGDERVARGLIFVSPEIILVEVWVRDA
jgi:hypothetical protein